MLGKIISEEQTSFLKGRNINESIFMVNEVSHAMKIHKVDGIIMISDFSKAYDSWIGHVSCRLLSAST